MALILLDMNETVYVLVQLAWFSHVRSQIMFDISLEAGKN